MIRPENKLDKKAFAVTGKLTCPRETIKAIIKAKGGIWKNQMSNQTDVLVRGFNRQNPKKHKKAIRLGKQIINEEELFALLRSD